MPGHVWTPKIESFFQEQFKSGDIKVQESAKNVFVRYYKMLGDVKRPTFDKNFNRLKQENMLDGDGGEYFCIMFSVHLLFVHFSLHAI